MADHETMPALPPLYYACMADDLPLVKKLLEEGANPNDGESVYHSAQTNRRACLELLLAHGADLSGRNADYHNTPLYFIAGHRETDAAAATALEGMRWLLEHGADPNVTSEDMDETPLQCLARHGWGRAAAELFLSHGADPSLRRKDGRTAYELAIRTGNEEMASSLRERGGVSEIAPVDVLLGACMRADEAQARAMLAQHPGLIETLTRDDAETIVQAVYERRGASIRLMVSLGFDLGAESAWAGTALHHAAWLGNAEMVAQLLPLGAPVNVRDSRFGSSPIAWAAHGSTNNVGGKSTDYPAVVRSLLDAGAERAPSVNRWDEPPESLASPEVLALLRSRGFAP